MTNAQLKKFNLFSELSAAQVSKVQKIVSIKSFKMDEIITHEGDDGDALYLLLKGSVEISLSLTMMVNRGDLDTREKSLTRLHAGDSPYFGEMAILRDGCRRSATVKTLEDSIVGVINRRDLLSLCDKDTDLGYHLFLKIAKRLALNLDKANKDITKLTTAFSLVMQG
jgi:CRP-like cAMP-binding protein